MARHSSDRSASPVRGRESPHKRSQSRKERSPGRRRSSRRSKSPAKNSSSHRTRSPDREKRSSRARSPRHAESNSPLPRSPSPRTKRLTRAQAEREVEKVTEKEYEKNGSKDRERARHREKSSEREVPREKAERRSEKDNASGEFSRSRRERERSVSPTIHHHRGRHSSHSPPRDAKNGYDEVCVISYFFFVFFFQIIERIRDFFNHLLCNYRIDKKKVLKSTHCRLQSQIPFLIRNEILLVKCGLQGVERYYAL